MQHEHSSGSSPARSYCVARSTAIACVALILAAAVAGAQDPTLSIQDAQGQEGSQISFVVTLTDSSGEDVTASWTTGDGSATAPADYTSANGTLTFAAGATRRTVVVSTQADTVVEGDETFTVTLSNPSGALLGSTFSATGTIQDDDTASLTIAASGDGAAVEGGDIEFEVTLSTTSTRNVTASGGGATTADFASATGSVNIPAGQTAYTVTISTVDDDLDEDDETFTVTLSSPSGALLGSTFSADGTINDNDPQPSVTISDASADEGDGVAFGLSLSSASGRVVTVPWTASIESSDSASTNDLTAMSGTATITAGNTSATLTVSTQDDTVSEGDETFTVTLSAPTNADLGSPSRATGTIRDDDASSSFSIAGASVTEGDTGTSVMAFTVTLSPASGQRATVNHATVAGTATGGTDYVHTTGTLDFSAGETTETVRVTVIGDPLHEADETFTVALSSAVNATLDFTADSATGTSTTTTPRRRSPSAARRPRRAPRSVSR